VVNLMEPLVKLLALRVRCGCSGQGLEISSAALMLGGKAAKTFNHQAFN